MKSSTIVLRFLPMNDLIIRLSIYWLLTSSRLQWLMKHPWCKSKVVLDVKSY